MRGLAPESPGGCETGCFDVLEFTFSSRSSLVKNKIMCPSIPPDHQELQQSLITVCDIFEPTGLDKTIDSFQPLYRVRD